MPGRDLATVLTEVVRGPEGVATVAGLGFLLLVLGTVVWTSTVRRPATTPDRAVGGEEVAGKVPREGYETGVKDAGEMRFADARDVVETLARVSLAPATAWQDGDVLVVEMPATTSSRDGREARRPVCQWEAGFLHEGMRRFAAGPLEVRETACRATGAPACRFMVRGPLRAAAPRMG